MWTGVKARAVSAQKSWDRRREQQKRYAPARTVAPCTHRREPRSPARPPSPRVRAEEHEELSCWKLVAYGRAACSRQAATASEIAEDDKGGGVNSTKVQLYKLSKRAAAASAIDCTLYGRAAASPRSFIQHHSQRISCAAVMWDAEAICKRVVTHKQEACLLPRPHPTTSVTVA
jgi:hypothetical protein